MNTKQPFSVSDQTDYPISLYAATKKANEAMAYSYSHLYQIPTTGLRFFTVYGPLGRPDMAYYKFTKAILDSTPIDVYNNGQMQRDFTYIDDVVECIKRLIEYFPQAITPKLSNAQAPYQLFNIGNNQPTSLRRFIQAIETVCNKKANENPLPMQAGDVPITYADIDALSKAINYNPSTSIEIGIEAFVNWYRQYHQV